MFDIKTLRRWNLDKKNVDESVQSVSSAYISNDVGSLEVWLWSFDSFLIMATLGSPCILIFVFLMLSAVGKTISKPNSSTNVSQISPAKDKCHNMYTSNNFYAGPNKKVEALLHEIKQELGEMREDIKSLKDNKTTNKGW